MPSTKKTPYIVTLALPLRPPSPSPLVVTKNYNDNWLSVDQPLTMGRNGQKVAKSIKTSCNFHLNCNFWGYIWSTEKVEYILESVGPK